MNRFANVRLILLVGAVLTLVVITGDRNTQAHKGVTSPYTYNKDVFPIVRDSCARCHIKDGPAPMALTNWNDGPDSATPWAEGIREFIISEQMPPWYVDPLGPPVKGGYGLTPAESDKLITWATGGTPQGDVAAKPQPITFQSRWSGGTPDLKVQMEAEHTMAESVADETKEFIVPTGLTEARWVKGVDLLPGTPSIVRNAVIATETGATLAVWVPGDDLVTAPSGAAFKLPAGAKLRLQIHYRKQWQNEGKALKDRSTIGLYFADAPASGREIQSVAIDGPGDAAADTKAFTGTLASAARVVAVRPSLDQPYGSFTIQAITPTGAKVPLLKLRGPRPEWRRRYWLAEPVELPAGSKIEVSATPVPVYIDLSGARLMKPYPLQVAVDFVPQS